MDKGTNGHRCAVVDKGIIDTYTKGECYDIAQVHHIPHMPEHTTPFA